MFTAVSLSTACAGRAPDPVAVVQPTDNLLSCSAMLAEISSNNDRITGLGSEKGAKVAQNVAAGVVGLVVWPVWFLMDFQGAAGTEIKALQDRNSYMATKVNEDGCAAPAKGNTVTASPDPSTLHAPPAPIYAPPATSYIAPAPAPVYAPPAGYAPSTPVPAYARATTPTYAPPAPSPTYAPPPATAPNERVVGARSYLVSPVGAFTPDPYAIDPYPAAVPEPMPTPAPASAPASGDKVPDWMAPL